MHVTAPAIVPVVTPLAGRPAAAAATEVTVEISSGASQREWDAFVRSHYGANGYHLWAWRAIFEHAFGHETVYLSALQNGEITGVLPLVILRSRLFGRCAVSLPFVDGGGVLAREPRIADRLIERAGAIAAAARLSHIELRHEARQCPGFPTRDHKVGMRLPLEASVTRQWEALDRKVRNQVRKAEKNGLTVRSGGIELVDAFYAVFARNMRDLGTPVYPRQLFQQAVTTLPDAPRVFLVNKGDTVVAAGIALVHRTTLAVPWASALREHLPLCPNILLYWRIMEHAIASGIATFDFGRSTPGEGTYQFKAQWGARPLPIHWEYLLLDGAKVPDLSPSNRRFKTAIAAWKRLPVPLTQWLGPRIVRSIP